LTVNSLLTFKKVEDMAEMSLDVQIQKLQEMESYLGEFCMAMNQHIDGLRDDLHAYKAAGFPREAADKYESQYYMQTRGEVDQMINRIHTNHYQYIDSVIADLHRARNR